MIIRWLGAFRKGASNNLMDSLKFELSRDDSDEVTAEMTHKKDSCVKARVGLKISRKAVFKKFNGDCWSEYYNGKLYSTRNPKTSDSPHTEVWAHPKYISIVVENFRAMKNNNKKAVVETAILNNLPVVDMTGKEVKY